MTSRSWIFLFFSIVYVGCAGGKEPASDLSVPPPSERLAREPETPAPPVDAAPAREPARSLEFALHEEVLELASLESANGSYLLALGRRTLWLLRVDAAEMELLHEADLLAYQGDRPVVARRARGCLQFLIPPDGAPEPWLHLFSTALEAAPAAAAAFRLQGDALVPMEPIWMGSEGALGPCDALQEGEQHGWPGRPWVVSSDSAEPVVFHLEENGELVARTATGGRERTFRGPWGEPLMARGDPALASLYVSSAALPGEPDHVQELIWQGGTLAPARRSRSFAGRIAAMQMLPGDGRFVVAEITEPHGTLLHLLRDDDLWVEDTP